jgi:predicted nucleotidyltransferase
MITRARVAELSRRITERFAPERIVLFGSHARGRARRDSDVDLLVVMRFRGVSARKAAEILNAVEPGFPVDLLVRTPQEVRRRLAQNDPFFGEIARHGKVLYDATRR